jgi:hypothetical protein
VETYQVLGLIGTLFLLVGAFMPLFFSFSFMGPGMMMGFGRPFFFFPLVFVMVPFVLGLIGSIIGDRKVAGVLLLLASVFSLPMFFGVFGVSFVLLLIAGILALTRS